MRTVLVTGSDTGVGKTWVVATIASLFAKRGLRVQVVKPVQTGSNEQAEMDVPTVLNVCNENLVTGHTLFSFSAPVSPLYAAELENRKISFDDLIDEVSRLSQTDYRIFEGAGSIAVPLDEDGRDWRDFAVATGADTTVLVVEDRVGAVGQSRMLCTYANGLPSGLWLNEREPQTDTERASTRRGIEQLKLPLWAVQNYGEREASLLNLDWL